MTSRIRTAAALAFVAAALLFVAAPAATAEEGAVVGIRSWLALGPYPLPLPAFADEEKTPPDAAFLLSWTGVDPSKTLPREQAAVEAPGWRAVWTAVEADSGGATFSAPADVPAAVWLAAWVEVSRWTEVEFRASATRPFELIVDGTGIITKKSAGGGEEKGTAKLARGAHLVLVRTVAVPSDTLPPWQIDASVSARGGAPAPVASISPRRTLRIGDIIDAPRVDRVGISPDGSLVAALVSRFVDGEKGRETRLEIRRFGDGSLVRTIIDVDGLSSASWAPDGAVLSWTIRDGKKGTIRAIDVESGEVTTIVEGIEHLGGHAWAPDNSYVVYSVNEPPAPDATGVKRLRGLYDRRDGARSRSYLCLAAVPGGATRRLTAGRHDAHLACIHPDGQTLLFTRYIEELGERPFGRIELVRFDVANGETEILWSGHWLGSVSYSPDGSRILATGGPSTFGDAGVAVPPGTIPNDYDGQAFIVDAETMDVEPITRDFDPAVVAAVWSRADGRIYLKAEEGEYVRLYRYDPSKKRFDRIETGVEVVGTWDLAGKATASVYVGSGAGSPPRLYALDLRRGKPRLLFDPAADLFADVRIGHVEPWNFDASSGKTIVGRVHYPPDFDAEKIWPCIVYYYGGTSPVDRSFGGRYPLDLWAAEGYVVYCLQPSGATGFGQEFSARHVNDWGKTTAGEIIEGAGKFLEAHPFVDPHRVGCIGASFGGFMTQLVVTRTDLFAAAVSHAGISMIASYWGEGYWGFGYNAVAAANSFPWNRRDIYVDQSPLFAADRVRTPLLLLHGASDTNVPPGESEQMYTALKLLGRPVEYIKFDGQNHFILDHDKRVAWSNAIVAWFDRWLKDEPAWWNDMYPPDETGGPPPPRPMEAKRIELSGGGAVLLGEVTRDDLFSVDPGWDEEYAVYEPDPDHAAAIGDHVYDAGFVVVLGSWCADSRREVPRLWKILDAFDYPLSEISMYAVASSRHTTAMGFDVRDLAWSDAVKRYFDVERVATIIVKRNGKEIGRIVETPDESIDADLARILAGTNGTAK
ncbi:MAG: S9 family peptidase [Candidatus Krumholzibacteriota bacterium]|nr:S9 family peptidase [Candidatus Krumholzibacteriota bacterium]